MVSVLIKSSDYIVLFAKTHHLKTLYIMPETLWHCRVKEFGPLIVSIDTEGRNLFEENKVIFNERKEKAIEEICKYVSFIK